MLKKEALMVTLDVISSAIVVLVLGAALVAGREMLLRRDLRPVPVQARRIRRVNRRS